MVFHTINGLIVQNVVSVTVSVAPLELIIFKIPLQPIYFSFRLTLFCIDQLSGHMSSYIHEMGHCNTNYLTLPLLPPWGRGPCPGAHNP